MTFKLLLNILKLCLKCYIYTHLHKMNWYKKIICYLLTYYNKICINNILFNENPKRRIPISWSY